MKLTVLVDNQAKIDKYLLAEPALSFYIETDNKNILFDSGYSDVFMSNAFSLGIDLKTITDVVLSHRHNDHTGGMFYLTKYYQHCIDMGIRINAPQITAHPDVFCLYPEKIKYLPEKEQLKHYFKLNLTRAPYQISEKIWFLGEIKNNTSDCIDDSAICYKGKDGLVIITGCSHAGLKNIIEQAIDITSINKINSIIGGFHLLNKDDNEVIELCEYLSKFELDTVYPCHCSDLKAKIIMSKYLPIQELACGSILEFS